MHNYDQSVEMLSERLITWSSTLHGVSIASKLDVSEIDDRSLKVSIPIQSGNQTVNLNVTVEKDVFGRVALEPALLNDLVDTASHQLSILIAHAFYRDYEILFAHDFEQSMLTVLEAEQTGNCRFCDRSVPEVTFSNDAHAIPECTGNKVLFTNYECDECNHNFGIGIEDHFGRWSNVERTVFLVEGKTGVPTLTMKRGHVKPDGDLTEIKLPNDSMITFDPEKTKGELRLIRPSHVPVAVIKAFYKMALSVMPQSELVNFKSLIAWIKNRDHGVKLDSHHGILFATFCPAEEHQQTRCFLLKRRFFDLTKPYMTFVLAFGNFCYQIFLLDGANNEDADFTVTPFFYLFDKSPDAPSRSQRLDMRSPEMRKNEEVWLTLRIFGPIEEGQANLIEP